jgi:uncharacterized protein YijF (DUF1287 family)
MVVKEVEFKADRSARAIDLSKRTMEELRVSWKSVPSEWKSYQNELHFHFQIARNKCVLS